MSLLVQIYLHIGKSILIVAEPLFRSVNNTHIQVVYSNCWTKRSQCSVIVEHYVSWLHNVRIYNVVDTIKFYSSFRCK